ncbi:hypothetical protein ABQZ69_17680 [Xanthomonas sp. WHRI 8391]|uniref:hypothetical protein n=1 Tax=Xanthomonas TaxID=338 RepID=UPI0020CBE700|nr:hypothetical protein [Xanthomonas hortorum]UTS73733.1 hypothetical protein NMB96_02420 [Xanthomonas hortorum]
MQQAYRYRLESTASGFPALHDMLQDAERPMSGILATSQYFRQGVGADIDETSRGLGLWSEIRVGNEPGPVSTLWYINYL